MIEEVRLESPRFTNDFIHIPGLSHFTASRPFKQREKGLLKKKPAIISLVCMMNFQFNVSGKVPAAI